uniref:Uncharacterized protein n=1 Tax=Rhizophora mucronata TaxID=61149 RepID=A0A2P2QA94_RHIMU
MNKQNLQNCVFLRRMIFSLDLVMIVKSPMERF